MSSRTRRIPTSMSLPMDLIDFLSEADRPSSRMVEEALRAHFKLGPNPNEADAPPAGQTLQAVAPPDPRKDYPARDRVPRRVVSLMVHPVVHDFLKGYSAHAGRMLEAAIAEKYGLDLTMTVIASGATVRSQASAPRVAPAPEKVPAPAGQNEGGEAWF